MRPPFVVLDFPAPSGPTGGTLLFERPREVLVAMHIGEVEGVLRAVDTRVAGGAHVVGFVAYEAAPAFDPAFATSAPRPMPLAWFGVFDAPRVIGAAPAPAPFETSALRWHMRTDAQTYGHAIATIRESIARGDVYQVNHTVRLDVNTQAEPHALYRRLLAAQGGGYGAHLHTGRHEILSVSPELFFHRQGDTIVTKPMKGTARRGRWLEEDRDRAETLATSEKERAENVMIVDLLRNDLGRIAQTGTVEVSRLFEVERHPTVLQMTSTVRATLRPRMSTWDVFAALFPCGSVTGAPKVAATRTIAALEAEPRGVYCGAIGYLAPDGTSTFNVAIRTLVIDHDTSRAEYGVGGGITWDSITGAEYDEVLTKAAVLTAEAPVFELLETLRLTDGRYARLERHLERLGASAEYFDFADPAEIMTAARHALATHATATGREVAQRIRLLAARNGTVRVETAPLPASTSDAPQTIALATEPVRRNDPFLYHKTTHRAVYEQQRARHPEAFDVLLWNEDGELTEFTIGNVAVELDGARWTPPRSCGLLAGTFRAELLEMSLVRERVIHRSELPRVTAMWLVNSLREWVPVRY